MTCWLIMIKSSALAFLALYQMLMGEDSLRYVILALSIDSILFQVVSIYSQTKIKV